MKAVVCRRFGPLEALAVEDVPDPVPGPTEVVLDVEAASVNYPDALIAQGKYQVRPELPFVPGFECAGTISAIGEDVRGLRLGATARSFGPAKPCSFSARAAASGRPPLSSASSWARP